MKLAFEVLDLENSISIETSGLGCSNPCFSNAGVANSASGLSRVLYLGRKPNTRPRSDLHWLTPRLKFTTSIASALQLFLFFFVPALTEF